MDEKTREKIKERYISSLDIIKNNKWNSLDENSKVQILQNIENEYAQRNNRDSCFVFSKPLASNPNGTTMGYYDPEYKAICVNSNTLNEFSEYGNDYNQHIDTVLHEGRHAYQEQAVKGNVKHTNQGEVASWKKNMLPGNYIRHEKNEKAYYNQPIEKDAFSFSKEKLIEIQKEIHNSETKTEENKMAYDMRADLRSKTNTQAQPSKTKSATQSNSGDMHSQLKKQTYTPKQAAANQSKREASLKKSSGQSSSQSPSAGVQMRTRSSQPIKTKAKCQER